MGLDIVAFHETRRGFMEAFGTERRQIRPLTPLQELLSNRYRRENWRRIQGAMKLGLPALQYSARVVWTLLSAGLVLAVTAGIYGRVGVVGTVLLFLPGLMLSGLLLRVSRGLAVAFPKPDATVGDLARDVLVANYTQLAQETGGWNDRDVWVTLCRVIVRHTGVAREKITPEADFVYVLRMD